MDLTAIGHLNPTHDAKRRLLVLELDHGKANEMGTSELSAFEALCEAIEGDESVMCLCTTSRRISKRGKPIFIAGANVTERQGWDDDRVREHVIRQRTLMRRLRRLPVFHVVLSHGVTLGWGTEYVLTGDYAVATATASFALPETGLGIVPGARGTAELAALIGPAHALRMGCTGEALDATQAQGVGLVQEVVADLDEGLARVHALAERLRDRSPTAVFSFKEALLSGVGTPEAQRVELERRAYEHTVSTGEAATGRAAFAEIRQGRAPTWGPRRVLKA